jgi:hypothetical protein
MQFEFEFKRLETKKFYTKSKEGDRLLLENLAKSGLVNAMEIRTKKASPRNKRTKSNQRLKL